jgi:hypothetical protein
VPRQNRRAFYRIPYPHSERPRLVLGSCISEVIDCSEQGIQFAPSALVAHEIGSEVEGRLRFRSGEEVRICGRITRADSGCVALNLSGLGIPFSAILREQLYLRQVNRQQQQAVAPSHA